MTRRRIVVHGAVQGVGFRWACTEQARARGLRGWVRNRADGTVEAVAEGGTDAVQALVAWAHHGPPQARVDRVEVAEEPEEGLTGFRVAG